MRNEKEIDIRGRRVPIVERNALDVLAWEGKELETGRAQLEYMTCAISDAISAGYSGKFLGKWRAKRFSPKKLLMLSQREILELFEIVYYELEENERRQDNNNGVKKKQETSQVESLLNI